jgi:hypothetical protein
MTLKVCSKCCESFDLEAFRNDKSRSDGKYPICKSCCKRYDVQYSQRRKELDMRRKQRQCIKAEKKRCSLCKSRKAIKFFWKDTFNLDGRCSQCIQCQKKYRENNSELIKNRFKLYYAKNKKAIISRTSEYNRNRRRNDPSYKLQSDVRKTIQQTIQGKCLINGYGRKTSEVIFKHLPYTAEELKQHLESQFEFWMNWNNHGVYKINGKQVWHIDHIIPQSALPYDSFEHENFQKCWALKNLRPLEAGKNIIKGSKLEL